MVNRSPWPTVELSEAQPSSRSGQQRLAARVAMRRGRRGATEGLLTGAWMVVRRRTGGGASTQNGDGTGAVEGRRMRVGGVGCSSGVGATLL
jgi:hypothetical protein